MFSSSSSRDSPGQVMFANTESTPKVSVALTFIVAVESSTYV